MGSDAYSEAPAFDHLLHWVPDVPAAVEEYQTAGMPAHVNPTAHGFQNGGWRLDERYIEILTVTDEEQLQRSRFAPGVNLLRPAMFALGGDHGAITFAVNVTDAKRTASRLRAQGHEVQEFEVTLEEHGVSFVEVFLTDATRPWTPFFITYDPPREEIFRQIDVSQFERGPYDLAGLEITSPQPDQARDELAVLLGIDPEGNAIELPGGFITFTSGNREAITAVRLSGDNAPAVDIHGLRFH